MPDNDNSTQEPAAATPSANQPNNTQPIHAVDIPDSVKGSDRFAVYPDLPSADLANDSQGGALSPTQTPQTPPEASSSPAVSDQPSVQTTPSITTDET